MAFQVWVSHRKYVLGAFVGKFVVSFAECSAVEIALCKHTGVVGDVV